MSISNITAAAKEMLAGANEKISFVINGSDGISNHLSTQLESWQLEANAALQTGFPLSGHEQTLRQWIESADQLDFERLEKTIEDYSDYCKAAKIPSNIKFWHDQLDKSKELSSKKSQHNLSLTATLLLRNWQESVDRVRSEWEFEEIARRRAEFMKKINELLDLLKSLQDSLHPLGFDTGVLLDLSRGKLSLQDIQSLRRWAAYLSEDPGVRSLCDLLGKIRQIELSERIEKVKVSRAEDIYLPDINSREEIVGIRLGRDLEHALPGELALLADPDTAMLFDLKFVESRLMCFDMHGIQKLQRHVVTEEERACKEADRQGPMVICIDTSGSMNGTPETVAKAVSLFMAMKAREQKRPCYLINFSTEIDSLDLASDFGMEALMQFLQMSFHGGTDVAPAMSHALEVMQDDDYENADLLIVSDFVMSGLPAGLLEKIESQRAHGNKFYSLVVGDCFMTHRLKSVFDHEWVYDPASSHVHELIGFQQRLNSRSLGQAR